MNFRYGKLISKDLVSVGRINIYCFHFERENSVSHTQEFFELI